MAGTENSEGPKQDMEHGRPVPVEQPETSRPMASTPNLFFLSYLVFLIFNIIRNSVAEIKPESLGTVIGYMAMLFIPFSAVAAYNLKKGEARNIGKVSVLITVFFLVFAMAMELGTASESKGRLAEAQVMINALTAHRAATASYVPEAVPPTVSMVAKLAVPLKGSISIKMDKAPMKTVELADPAIARVSTLSPYELRVSGLKKGVTSLSIKDLAGYGFAYEVNVE